MAYSVRLLLRAFLICVVLNSFGCTATKSIHISTPKNKMVETDVFTANIEPLKNDIDYFSTFMLTIVNKTDHNIELNWNESYYLHNKKSKSSFVFRSIEPSMVKEKTVPNDIIPANSRFSKKISPLSKIAYAKLASKAAIDDKGLYAGILPEGLNTIVLVVNNNGQNIKKALSVIIKEDVK